MKRATAVDGYTRGTDDISIHALVKRATDCNTVFIIDAYISIHALVKRATLLDRVIVARFSISIHALVKRATFYICVYRVASLIFQSTPS